MQMMSQVVKSWTSGVLLKTPCLFLCCYSGTLSFPSLSKCWWEGSMTSLKGASRRCVCLTHCIFCCSETNSCHFCARLRHSLSWLRICICTESSLYRGIHRGEGIGFACQNLSARADNSHVLHHSPYLQLQSERAETPLQLSQYFQRPLSSGVSLWAHSWMFSHIYKLY